MKHKETFTWAKKCILQENWIGASFVGNESIQNGVLTCLHFGDAFQKLEVADESQIRSWHGS